MVLFIAACSAASSRAPTPTGVTDSTATSRPSPAAGRLAYATPTEVRIRDGEADDVSAGSLAPGVYVRDLVWSTDGSRLAWTTVDEQTELTTVFLLDTDRPGRPGRSRNWVCPCSAIAFNGPTLFSDGIGTEADARNLYVYPDDGRPRDSVFVSGLVSGVRGAPGAESTLPVFQFLGGGGHTDGLVVGYTEGASSRGGPMDLYVVDPVGRARLLTTAQYSSVPRQAVFSPDGSKLAYVGTEYVFDCEVYDRAEIVDINTGAKVAPQMPSSAPWRVIDMWFESDGTLGTAMAARTPENCSAPPKVEEYRVSESSWIATHRPGRSTAYDTAGRKATSALPLPAPGSHRPPSLLTVEADGRTWTVSDVTVFRWVP